MNIKGKMEMRKEWKIIYWFNGFGVLFGYTSFGFDFGFSFWLSFGHIVLVSLLIVHVVAWRDVRLYSAYS